MIKYVRGQYAFIMNKHTPRSNDNFKEDK